MIGGGPQRRGERRAKRRGRTGTGQAGRKGSGGGEERARSGGERKKAEARPLAGLVSSVLQRLHLPDEQFRHFLLANGGLLRTIALKKRY